MKFVIQLLIVTVITIFSFSTYYSLRGRSSIQAEWSKRRTRQMRFCQGQMKDFATDLGWEFAGRLGQRRITKYNPSADVAIVADCDNEIRYLFTNIQLRVLPENQYIGTPEFSQIPVSPIPTELIKIGYRGCGYKICPSKIELYGIQVKLENITLEQKEFYIQVYNAALDMKRDWDMYCGCNTTLAGLVDRIH